MGYAHDELGLKYLKMLGSTRPWLGLRGKGTDKIE